MRKAKATKKRIRGRPRFDDDPADQFIQLRTTAKRKAAYFKAAKPETLSEWATRHLDKAAGFDPDR